MSQNDSPIRATVDLDHHSPDYRDHAYEKFRAMQESGCPVAFSEHHGGFWALADYASVFDGARDDDLFNSYPSVGVPASGMPFAIIPIESDPPQTKELREATLPQFSPGAADRLRPLTLQLADELIDEFIEDGSCDIVAAFTTPLPARLILRLLGWDETRYREWSSWVHSVVHERAKNPDLAGAAGMELFAEINKQLTERREKGLGGDLFSSIIRGTLDGQPLDDIQISMYGFLMMLGGMDTTSGLTGNVLLRISENEDLRKRLIDDPGLIVTGTDEFLRLDGPLLGIARTVSRDCEFHGQQLGAGDRAILMWGAANRDPEVFADPDTVDLTRKEARKHMAFGIGIHRCLGSHFAKVFFQVMLEKVLERLPDFALAGEYRRFDDASEVHAVCSLPITFTPGKRISPRT
ncbi:cytochrome P450 [Mycobacterium sp. URHB0044]|uniref:cytochrome P450 n=1 Tax=Mycobacterium sp. URHB0044 TaxID=1380386 RepID=UPI00049095F4|nr:cytochrome P450 [Mycobacterium sp. URHB0044]